MMKVKLNVKQAFATRL